MKNSLSQILLIVVIMMAASFCASAQEDEKKIEVDFSGFVKADIFWDTRQTVSVRQGHFLLYPSPKVLDENGDDINAQPSFNMLTIQTRLRTDITGPDILGARSSAAVEGEFFGHSNGDINGFRLRHAYIKLDWTNHSMLVGQYWHPMFVVSCFPGTVSFNTGAPFLPFTRNPQIRYIYKRGVFNMYATLYSQLDFMSNGPLGPSPAYLRNSAVPGMNLRFEYKRSNREEGSEYLLGVSGNYKTLKPSLYTPSGYKAEETISSAAAQVYLKVQSKKVTFKAAATWGQDTYDWTMIGGYAASGIINPGTGGMEYIPLRTLATWFDIHSNGKKLQAGLFAGYSKNLGTAEAYASGETAPALYARGGDIDYAYRVSPRLIYNINNFRIAPELEYTVAAYGTPDEERKVVDAEESGNLRLLLGVYYFF